MSVCHIEAPVWAGCTQTVSFILTCLEWQSVYPSCLTYYSSTHSHIVTRYLSLHSFLYFILFFVHHLMCVFNIIWFNLIWFDLICFVLNIFYSSLQSLIYVPTILLYFFRFWRLISPSLSPTFICLRCTVWCTYSASTMGQLGPQLLLFLSWKCFEKYGISLRV